MDKMIAGAQEERTINRREKKLVMVDQQLQMETKVKVKIKTDEINWMQKMLYQPSPTRSLWEHGYRCVGKISPVYIKSCTCGRLLRTWRRSLLNI